jgi:hypothetical protein
MRTKASPKFGGAFLFTARIGSILSHFYLQLAFLPAADPLIGLLKLYD